MIGSFLYDGLCQVSPFVSFSCRYFLDTECIRFPKPLNSPNLFESSSLRTRTYLQDQNVSKRRHRLLASRETSNWDNPPQPHASAARLTQSQECQTSTRQFTAIANCFSSGDPILARSFGPQHPTPFSSRTSPHTKLARPMQTPLPYCRHINQDLPLDIPTGRREIAGYLDRNLRLQFPASMTTLLTESRHQRQSKLTFPQEYELEDISTSGYTSITAYVRA